MIQCVKLPRLWPLARTRLGNTSLRYTQITAPCENAKNAMKPTSSHTSRSSCCALIEDRGHAGQAHRRPHRADQQQRLAPDPVDHRHRDHGEQQVGGADRHRLQVAGDLAESGLREDIVQVIQNRVDSGKLVEHPDRNRQENRQPVLPGKQRLRAVAVLERRSTRRCPAVRCSTFSSPIELQHAARLRHSALLHQPARAARNAEQHQQRTAPPAWPRRRASSATPRAPKSAVPIR